MNTETNVINVNDAVLTPEVLTEGAEAFVRSGLAMSTIPDEVYPELSAERAEKPVANPFAFGRGKNGFRNVGVRKLTLVNELAKTLSRLSAKGINTDYVLKKFTDWKGPIGTPTKKISGIISQVKSFENA